MKHVNLRFGLKVECKKFQMLTVLKDGKLWRTSDDHYCHGRCIIRLNDHANFQGPWSVKSDVFECDFIQAQCAMVGKEDIVYDVIHTQIYNSKEVNVSIPKKSKTSKSKTRPSVFVILIDSMGATQAHRNIPKTMHYFEKSMKAIDFPFLNKVGLNSRPNGFALWFGKLIDDIDRSVFGLPTLKGDAWWNETCKRLLDNETSIFDEFKNHGYKTLLADDWSRNIITWPDCYGYMRQPVDHTFLPFLIEMYSAPVFQKRYTFDHCYTLINEELDYLQKFINAYKDEPKFAWMWTSLVSHDDSDGSITMDLVLMEFLLKNRKVFDESFVFLMGDHGIRQGGITRTKIGAKEMSNPLLAISAPKHLRNTYVTERMAENAKSLQTHFDTRATMLDILKTYDLNFKNPAVKHEHGQSLLRKQHGERSCRNLPIPLEYCICEMNEKVMNTSLPISLKVGQAVISSVNSILEDYEITKRCPLWKFSHVVSIKSITPQEGSTAFMVTVAASEPYKQAEFRATVIQNSQGALTVGTIDRADIFGHRGKCAPGEIRRFCDCKWPKNKSA